MHKGLCNEKPLVYVRLVGNLLFFCLFALENLYVVYVSNYVLVGNLLIFCLFALKNLYIVYVKTSWQKTNFLFVCNEKPLCSLFKDWLATY